MDMGKLIEGVIILKVIDKMEAGGLEKYMKKAIVFIMVS